MDIDAGKGIAYLKYGNNNRALMCTYGLFVPALTQYQVGAVFIFSALFTLGIDFPKFYIFRKFKLYPRAKVPPAHLLTFTGPADICNLNLYFR